VLFVERQPELPAILSISPAHRQRCTAKDLIFIANFELSVQ
jgi:hypothetical protein